MTLIKSVRIFFAWISLLIPPTLFVFANDPYIEYSEVFGSGGTSYDTLENLNWQDVKRIQRIEAWNGVFQFNTVFKEIQLTYERFDGTTVIASFGSRGEVNGKPLDQTLQEGEFINRVELSRGNFFDWIRITTNLGYDSGRLGANTDRNPNKIFPDNGGAIIGFHGGSGSVVDSR
jgi:Jacalin-like lectin domain